MPQDPKRAALISAASLLYRSYRERPDGSSRAVEYRPSDVAARYEAALVQAVEKAKEELRSYQETKAFRMGLDALLPGWFDMDVGDLGLPRELWHAFVSDNVEEWVEWLVEHGVDPNKARSEVGRMARIAQAVRS